MYKRFLTQVENLGQNHKYLKINTLALSYQSFFIVYQKF
jgi:hypothetical protein